MLTLDQLRKTSPKLQGLSDEKLEELRLKLYQAAELAFEAWWAKKNGSKTPGGLFPDKDAKDKI